MNQYNIFIFLIALFLILVDLYVHSIFGFLDLSHLFIDQNDTRLPAANFVNKYDGVKHIQGSVKASFDQGRIKNISVY